jgi:hypothetical protein
MVQNTVSLVQYVRQKRNLANKNGVDKTDHGC